MVEVDSRATQTLLPIIQHYMLPDIHIYTFSDNVFKIHLLL